MFSQEQKAQLARPINPDHVKGRSSAGQTLSYIEAHQAIRNANDLFGIGNWGYTVQELVALGEPSPVSKNGKNGFRAGYRAVVEVTVNDDQHKYVTFSDVGFGDGVDYSGSPISPQELAMKEAVSDGVKRALKNLGDQFGLGLYSADGRAQVEKAKKIGGSAAALKNEVFRIARERLGKDKPSAKEIAELFSVDAADLAEADTLRGILVTEGVL